LSNPPLIHEFMASGHPNISCSHHTTFMVTKDLHLSIRGDCVAAVGAEMGLADLPDEFREAAKDPDTVIELTLVAGSHRFTVVGRGHSKLTYDHPKDMVARRSNYTCSRTLMVKADKSAEDVPRKMLSAMQRPGSVITVTLTMRR
jgi:hypothetical protein